MKTLSITTATANLSVAITDSETVLAEQNNNGSRNHSVKIIPIIQNVLTSAKTRLSDIERIAVAVGPGSYTGLRIGITTAKIMAARLKIKVVGVSTLAALAANLPDDDLTVTLLDARNNNFFAGVYRGRNHAVLEDGHYPLSELLELVTKYAQKNSISQVNFVGDFKAEHRALVEAALAGKFRELYFGTASENLIHASKIGIIAKDLEAIDPARLLPRYLRKTQAEVDWEQKTGAKSLKDESKYVEEV